MDNPSISPNHWQLSLYYSWSHDTLDMSVIKRHTLYLYLPDRSIKTKQGVSGVKTKWTINRSINNLSNKIVQQSLMLPAALMPSYFSVKNA